MTSTKDDLESFGSGLPPPTDLGSDSGGSGAEVVDSGQTGSAVNLNYINRAMNVVPVNVDELKSIESDGPEIAAQFIVAEFFAAGAFWLAIERAISEQPFWKDGIFWACVATVLVATMSAIFAFRQGLRRSSVIKKIISQSK